MIGKASINNSFFFSHASRYDASIASMFHCVYDASELHLLSFSRITCCDMCDCSLRDRNKFQPFDVPPHYSTRTLGGKVNEIKANKNLSMPRLIK